MRFPVLLIDAQGRESLLACSLCGELSDSELCANCTAGVELARDLPECSSISPSGTFVCRWSSWPHPGPHRCGAIRWKNEESI